MALQVRDAMRTNGFFYVVGHGYDPEQVRRVILLLKIKCSMYGPRAQTSRIFDIADIPFAHTSEEEKVEYAGQMKVTGSYQGYKARSYWVRRLLADEYFYAFLRLG